MTQVVVVGKDTHFGSAVDRAMLEDTDIELLGSFCQGQSVAGPGPVPAALETVLCMSTVSELIVIDCSDSFETRLANAEALLTAGISLISICDGFTEMQIEILRSKIKITAPCVIDQYIELPKVIASVLGEVMNDAFPDHAGGFRPVQLTRHMHVQRSTDIVCGLKASLHFIEMVREAKASNDIRFCTCVTDNIFSAADAFMGTDSNRMKWLSDSRSCDSCLC